MSDTDPDGTATTFTQEQVTAAATKAAKEAERKARQASHTEIAASLGVTVDEAKAIIAKAKADEEANATELDRARKAQAEAEAKAAQAEAQVAAVTARATATTALVAAGVQAAVIDDALRLIDTDADDIAGEVTALAARLPALFTPATDGTPPPPAPHLRPATPPTGTGGGSNPKEQAAAMRAAVFPTRKPAA